MDILFPAPVFRFFDKEKYANEMLFNGEIFFNTINSFPHLENEAYRDEREGFHTFKVDSSTKKNKESIGFINSHTIKTRKIPDAWVFCGTCSTASDAKKVYCVQAAPFGNFFTQIHNAVVEKFNKELPILFSPVSYVSEKPSIYPEAFATYFTKQEKFKGDVEFRIVIIPPKEFLLEPLKPLTLKIANPTSVFKKIEIIG